MPQAVVSARALSKSFAAKDVLREISVDVEPGDIVGVLGKNGAGKTTLLELLLGFSIPTSGSAEIFGERSADLSAAAKKRIGFVPQQDELIDLLTGAQQLNLTAAFYEEWDRALIERLSGEWEIPLERRIQTLSVGERQKLSLLLALGAHPELLVLDEPVASLDPIARRQFIAEIVDRARGTQRTVLFSSHIVSDLERAANKVWIVKEGRLAWAGDLDALKESVVRLHVHGRRALPGDLGVADVLTTRVDGSHATVAATHWTSERTAALAARLDADVEVESLALEDIFLELHR
jgi:ABC-2 type transport system ATP-binding protein